MKLIELCKYTLAKGAEDPGRYPLFNTAQDILDETEVKNNG